LIVDVSLVKLDLPASFHASYFSIVRLSFLGIAGEIKWIEKTKFLVTTSKSLNSPSHPQYRHLSPSRHMRHCKKE